MKSTIKHVVPSSISTKLATQTVTKHRGLHSVARFVSLQDGRPLMQMSAANALWEIWKINIPQTIHLTRRLHIIITIWLLTKQNNIAKANIGLILSILTPSRMILQ